jgi:hypothetical protein
MRAWIGWWSAAVLAGLILVTAARADEEKVPLDKLPKAVTDAVKAKYPGAKLTGAEKEKEKDQTVYEVALEHKGQKLEVTLKPDGTIVSVEKEIAAKDLPKAVTAALDSKYPKATIKKVEEITTGEKVTYEVLLVTAAKKRLEVVFDTTGKVIEEESKEKD